MKKWLALLVLLAAFPAMAQRGGSAANQKNTWPTCTSAEETKIVNTVGNCPTDTYFCLSTDGNSYRCKSSAWTKVATPTGAGGSSVAVDIDDDDSNETSGATEIATTGDTYDIFAVSGNKLTIDATKRWPTCDTGDSATAFFSTGTITEARISSDLMRDTELPGFTATFTNKTYDAAATGNVLKIADLADCTIGFGTSSDSSLCWDDTEKGASSSILYVCNDNAGDGCDPGDWVAVGGNATSITDGLIVEPDLDADNSATDGDVLTYDSTGTNFAWISPAAGTDITADLEEEGQVNATAVTGNASSGAVMFGTGSSTAGWDTTPAIDCTDCTNVPGGTIDALGDAAADGTVYLGTDGTPAEYSQTWEWNVVDPTTEHLQGLILQMDMDTTATDSYTQKVLDVRRKDSAGDQTLEILIDVANNDTDAPVNDGIRIVAAYDGGITDAIDASDSDITNALNMGTNNIVTGASTIASTELDRLDGLNAALVDLNDSPTWTGTHTFSNAVTVSPSATPGISWEDSDSGDSDEDAAIDIADDGSNNASMTFQVEDAGTMTDYLKLDGASDAFTFSAASEDLVGTFTSNTLTFTSTTGVATINFPDGSIPTADLATEVRSMYWGAGAMSTDGTDCSAAAEDTLASGPKIYLIDCPMGSTDTDGFIYGSTVLPDAFNAAGDVRFTLVSVVETDGGGNGTFHGSIGVQCVAAGEAVTNTWGTEADLDIAEVTADLVDEILNSDSDADVDTAGCAADETLFWRLKMCDSSGTASTNCTNSTAQVMADMNIVGLKMEYTTDIGDN